MSSKLSARRAHARSPAICRPPPPPRIYVAWLPGHVTVTPYAGTPVQLYAYNPDLPRGQPQYFTFTTTGPDLTSPPQPINGQLVWATVGAYYPPGDYTITAEIHWTGTPLITYAQLSVTAVYP